MESNKITVLIVDDSALIRKVLTEVLESDPQINIIGAVADPIFAMKRMETQWPDVIVLDVEMPRMDGITFLRKLMAERPTPVVMCSTLTVKGARTTMEALSLGAVDIVAKPKMGASGALKEESSLLINAVKSAAKAKLKRTIGVTKPLGAGRKNRVVSEKLSADAVIAPPSGNQIVNVKEKIVAIGTSTGGTQALEIVLTRLPTASPGIVIVQHMPEKFTAAFADRLNSICEITVKEAANNDTVQQGTALIAPGGKHMLLKRRGEQYYVEVVDGPLVSRHRPSVDVLFRSVAKVAGKNALGVIMTGMGDDGANGLKEMHDAGAYTIGQNEASCVVYGMPKEAHKRGAVDREFDLPHISTEIVNFLMRRI